MILAILSLGADSQVCLGRQYLTLYPMLSCCVCHVFQLGFAAILPSAEHTLSSSVEKGCCETD